MELKNQELLKTDHVYPSGFLYPRDQVQKLLQPNSTLMQRVSRGMLRGEIAHPSKRPDESDEQFQQRVATINEANVSHRIENLEMDEQGVVRGTVISTGPYRELMERTVEQSFGIRAFMQTEVVNGVKQPRPGSLNVVTFDLINSQRQVQTKYVEMFNNAYVVSLGELGKKAMRVMDEQEVVMFSTLHCMAQMPEGVNLPFDVVQSFYRLARTLSETMVRHYGEQNPSERKHRLRSLFLLVSALQPIELEKEGKGEIFRLYDQTRRIIIASYEREVKALETDSN